MIARLLPVLVLLGLAGRALAQPMMDPREVSGQPRPDAQVGLATLTVRVVQGEMNVNAPAGTPVHLARLGADGSMTVVTRPTDAQGRATFADLDTTGGVSYYAYALLGRDRLESRVITLDKMAGIRLLLAGKKPTETEPIDDTRGDGIPAVPAGEVVTLLQGVGLAAGQEVELVRLVEAGEPVVVAKVAAQAATGRQGLSAHFTGVAAAPGVHALRTFVQGKAYISKPFMLRDDVGVGRQLLVIDRIIVGTHFAAELDDEQLRCQMQFVLQNVGGSPISPGEEGLKIPLPRGATQPALDGEHPGRTFDGEGNLVVRHDLAPGRTEIIVAFGLPLEGGVVAVDMPVPLGLFESSVIIEWVPGAKMEGPSGMTADVRETEEGRRFFVITPLSLPPGQDLSFRLTGMPQRPQAETAVKVIAGVLVLLMIGVALFITFSPRRGARGQRVIPGDATQRRKTLTVERERLYEALVALERERQRGGEPDVLARRRAALIAQLTVTLRELDELDAQASAS
jgi:hypothetical protein